MGDTVLYEAADAVATLTLNRPERRNAITPQLVEDFDAALARALDDDEVRVVRLRGAGSAFCAGYDIGWGSESMQAAEAGAPWDPIADYQTMRRFVDAYMALWRSPKPVVAQVHGYCVAGGTDFALCSDLIVCAEDCRIGYPPARVWGSPTTAMWMYRLGLERSKRLLLTGDAIDGARAVQWGLASEAVPAAQLEQAGLALARRVALLPHNQAAMMKLLVNQAFEQMGLHTTQLIGTLLDGAARHTPEGTAFTQRGLADVRGAVADRDAPFGDYGQGPATV
jgi:enoyl-CoA hydratase